MMENDAGTAQIEMPQYKSHKIVWALKIKEIHPDEDGGAIIHPADAGYADFRVIEEFVKRHNPKEGGYYVVYKDGYSSYSPAQPFEEGYQRI